VKRKIVYTAAVIGVLFLGAQIVQPDRTNPPIENALAIATHISVPPDIDSILRNSCFDCHSNETRWPWYSYVAPASWMVARDVAQARRRVNFSEWGKYKRTKALSALESICDETTARTMPLPQYALMHPGATLSQDQIDRLCAWSESQIAALLSANDNP